MFGEYAWHHRHLDITRDAEFTLDALLGSSGLLQLVVGSLEFCVSRLQLLVGSGKTLLGTTAVERIDDEEGSE